MLGRLPERVVEEHLVKGYVDRWVREVLLAEGGLEYIRSLCPNIAPRILSATRSV